jgi:hypothetical protein
VCEGLGLGLDPSAECQTLAPFWVQGHSGPQDRQGRYPQVVPLPGTPPLHPIRAVAHLAVVSNGGGDDV